MKQKKEEPKVVLSSEEMDTTIADDDRESVAANAGMVTPAVKGKKLGIKRIKTKELNISKGKLKSVSASKNFSFLNKSVKKETLRANNRALAQNLAKVRQDNGLLNIISQKQQSQIQELCVELNKLKRLVGLKDEEIQQEVLLRIQEEIQEIESWTKQLTKSLIDASTFINNIHEKCRSFCPRRSTDSSRSLSFGSIQAGLKPMGSSSRPLFKDKSPQNELMTKYLSKADEFLAPPGGRVYQDKQNLGVADMSVIAEQSMIENDEELYMAHPLTSVPEITSDSNSQKSNSNPVSKLPHRILKPTKDSTSNSNSNASGKTVDLAGSNKIGSNSPDLNKKNSEDALKQSVVTKEKEKGKSKDSGEKTKPNSISDNEKSIAKTKSKDKKNNSMSGHESKNDLKKINTAVNSCMSKTAVTEDLTAEIDRSAFGFGGSFVEDLVSGSPIALEKRRETFVKVKHSEKTEPKIIEEPKDQNQKETVLMTKPQVETKKKKDDKTAYTVKGKTNKTEKNRTDNHLSLSKVNSVKRNTFATDNPFVPKSTLFRTPEEMQVPVKKNNSIDDSIKPTLSLIKSQELDKKEEMEKATLKPVDSSSKNQESDEKYDSIKDPFVPKSTLFRTPYDMQVPVKKNNNIDDSIKPTLSLIKSQELDKKKEMEKATLKPVDSSSKNQESDEKYDSIKDPFKPSKTLVRSPHRPTTVQNANPEKKVDGLAFLSSLCERIERKQVESLPLPQPSFGDEPTTYFNSEMEFTSVIDSSKLQASLQSGKNSPPLPLELVNEVVDGSETQKSSKSKDNLGTKEPKKNKHSEKSDKVVHDHNEPAAVEVRTRKPGVFTFNVSRKDADGTRKPVPENVSRARSKKKKPLTPEKEERKTGADRDTFNFGDRTPTMPLEKLKEKSVYDLSMNESVKVPGNTLKNFKEKEKLKIPDPKPDEHIYYLPMKPVSPDDKPAASKSARSQSRSRSKSQKKLDNDDDDDWMRGKKPRDRSKSRSRKTEKDEDKTQRRDRSRSRAKDINKDAEESSEGVHVRSKSRSEKTLEEDSSRRARSRTRREILGSTENENLKQQGELYDNSDLNKGKSEKQEPVLRRGRSQSRKRHAIDTEVIDSNDDASSKENFRQRSKSVSSRNDSDHPVINTVRGRSKSKSMVDDTELESDDESNSNINRRGRSKSKARSQNENTDSELEKASLNTETNRRGRSKSKTRSKLDVDESDLDNVEEKPTLNLELRGRSKSKARSKTDAEDRVEEMPTLNPEEKSHTRGRSKSKARDNSEHIETETEKVNRILEQNIAEFQKSIRSTRSKSIPKVIVYTECDSTLEDNEEEDESPLLMRKSKSRSIHKKKQVYVESDSTEKDGDSDVEVVEVSKARKSLSRSIKRKHSDIKAQETDEVERKKIKGDVNGAESADAKSKPATCIPEFSSGSDDEVLITKTDSVETFITDPLNNKRIRKSTFVAEDSDSDFNGNVKNDRLKLKSKQEVKPVNEHRKDNNAEDRMKNLTDETTESESNEIKERDKNEIKESNMKRLDMMFANSRRGKSSKTPNLEDLEADMNEEIDTEKDENKKTSSKQNDEKINIEGEQEIPVSPPVRKRSEARKSTKKSTRKKKTEMTERSTKKLKLNLADDQLDDDDRTSSGSSTVTPAVVKEPGTKKSSKSSRTAKSSRKVKSELIPDETPLIKVEKVSSMSEDKQSSLALFRKRLTAVGAKKTAQTEDSADNPSAKKRSEVELPVPDDLEPEGSESSDNKRTRRHKTPVSYVAKPLNEKLRRGDKMFKESGISKGKAEQMRLMIAKKTSVLKVSRDDQEDVMQCAQDTLC